MRFWPGYAAATFVTVLLAGSLLAVFLKADEIERLTAADWAAIRFTVLQAFLSASISVALAIPVARALSCRRFFGRQLLITLLGAPFILPVIVAVLGLLAVFGRSGIVSTGLGWLGLPPLSIYGLHGVVLAHVFFNLPLATRFFLQGWLEIPAERFRLAAALGLSARDVSKVLERPMIRAILPGTFMIIFVICTTSFAVALTLGGGPKATTVELAIYQAFRFDFDLGKAAVLATVQFGICGLAALVMLRLWVPQNSGAGLDRKTERWDRQGRIFLWVDGLWIMAATLFLVVPLATIVFRGLPAVLNLPGVIWQSAFRSVWVALASAGISVTLAISLARTIVGARSGFHRRVLEAVGFLAIAASPLVIGTGLFLIVNPFVDPGVLALSATILINSVMALPFSVRVLVPAVTTVENNYGQLADQLGLAGWNRWKVVLFPRLKRPLGFAMGLAAALSMGDLGVIALFADANSATLPLQMYRLMGAYRMDQAAGAALLLLALSLTLFWVFDRGGRLNVDA